MNRYVISEEELKAAILIIGETPTKINADGLYKSLHKLPQYVEPQEEREYGQNTEREAT